jgi:hypothetical protein
MALIENTTADVCRNYAKNFGCKPYIDFLLNNVFKSNSVINTIIIGYLYNILNDALALSQKGLYGVIFYMKDGEGKITLMKELLHRGFIVTARECQYDIDGVDCKVMLSISWIHDINDFYSMISDIHVNEISLYTKFT